MADNENVDIDDFESSGLTQKEELSKARKAALINNLKNGGVFYLIIVLFVGGAIGYNYLLSSEDSEDVAETQSVSGGARVVGREKPTEGQDTSLIDKRRTEAVAQQVNEAKGSGDAFIGRIKLDNAVQVAEKNHDKAVTGNEDTAEILYDSMVANTPAQARAPAPAGRAGNNGSNGSNGKGQDRVGAWSIKDEVDTAKGLANTIKSEFNAVSLGQAKSPAFAAYASAPVPARGSNGGSGGSGNSEEGGGDLPLLISDESYEEEPEYTGKKIRIEADSRYAGFVTVGYDSDAPGMVAIELSTPPLDGAKSISSNVEVRGDYIYAEFNELIFKGKSHPIQAILINPNNMRAGYSDEVDNHYFERWVPFLIAAFGSGYPDTLTDSTSVVGSDGTVTTQTNKIDSTRDRAKYAAGRGLEKTLPILERQFDRPKSVYMYNNSEIGIWFLKTADLEV